MKSKEMKVKDLIRLLWRNILYVVLGLVLGIIAGTVLSNIQPPVYDATAKVFVSRPSQQAESSVLLLDDDQLLAINLQAAKFLSVREAVSSQLGGTISGDDILITEVPNTQIISIKVQAGDPQRAATIANLVVRLLIDENEKLLAARYTAFENTLDGQLEQVQKQMGSLQTQISQVSDTSVQEQLAQVDQQIGQLQTEITSLGQEIASFPYTLSPRQRIELAAKEAELDQRHALIALYQQIQTNLTYVGNPGDNGSGLQNPQLMTLQSTLDLYQQMNISLLNSREDARLARTQARQSVMQIVTAVPSGSPVIPDPTLYTLIGGFVGFVLTVVVILLIDHMDESLKAADQIEELLGVPVLGFVFANTHINNGLVTSRDPYSAEAEAFRALGADLEVTGAGKTIHTLLIVNAEPADARTNIAANLAVITAQQGKKVILLDGDLKHPHMHKFFGMENQKGLAELLNGRGDLKNARQVVKDIERLTLISSGVAEKKSTAWLDAAKWEKLLFELQYQADLVIVDGPPADVADAQILASKMDAVLLAIRSGHTHIDSAKNTLRRFQLIGARVAGAVLTKRARNQLVLALEKINSHKKEEVPDS
jgi:capsular exopolysaccharide synthesis family protein